MKAPDSDVIRNGPLTFRNYIDKILRSQVVFYVTEIVDLFFSMHDSTTFNTAGSVENTINVEIILYVK